ncbi:Ca-activated chloride channel family protein [Nonlabens xylanidelens]|uniref:Ca-activated chloride channel family protein n=1 Tax=Nonlabens xylanidelens TaxID=191564 RepID=A0A2S6IQM1_9FLAO|nr:VWA domain-containing protein [Nonlabens xylanidelens]PPK96455.1 Ca-activated chloride channel family protein [Nonlabens xylanidelens]PQJ18174.1 aerotolerance regulator BatA [Nonlabens xylanidelens]
MDWFTNIKFASPEMFWLLLLLPLAIGFYIWTFRRQNAQVKVSTIKGFQPGGSLLGKLRPVLFLLRLLALALIIVALARPQTTDVTTKTKTTNGIDIVLAVDVSASMLAQDLKPDRLEATKAVAADFINGRPSDRIGVVVYAGESYTKTPITTDKTISLKAIKDIKFDGVLENGTAIGMGLATAVNRLKESEALSKVIILMTDGVNNSGFLDPKIASELAVEFDIKVYTIGIGTNGNAPSPYAQLPNGRFQFKMAPVEIDEELMKQIAADTGGKYFRATNNKKLKEIYAEIDKLEKTEIEQFEFYNVEEKYRDLVLLALMLIGVEMLLRYTIFKTAA